MISRKVNITLTLCSFGNLLHNGRYINFAHLSAASVPLVFKIPFSKLATLSYRSSVAQTPRLSSLWLRFGLSRRLFLQSRDFFRLDMIPKIFRWKSDGNPIVGGAANLFLLLLILGQNAYSISKDFR